MEYRCKRCDKPLLTGYLIKVPAGEHGLFGSTCIKKVTGQSVYRREILRYSTVSGSSLYSSRPQKSHLIPTS